MTMANATSKIFERIVHWGPEPKKIYFACDQETFFMLKAIRKAYYKSLRQAATLQRWHNKAPHNRFVSLRSLNGDKSISKRRKSDIPIPKPTVNSFFVREESSKWTGQTRVFTDSKNFLAYFNLARAFYSKAEEVRPIGISKEQILEVYRKVCSEDC